MWWFRPLTVESIGPVCSPEYSAIGAHPNVEDLAGVRRLAPKTRPNAWAEWAVGGRARRDRTSSRPMIDTTIST